MPATNPATSHLKLAPSILAADCTRLGEQVKEALTAGADHVHVDVMDGHFVPNLTMGPFVVKALRPIVPPGVALDVHLMVERPEQFIPAFAEAGADILTVHVEACPDLGSVVQQIRALGVRPGVTLRPGTPLESLAEVLPRVDLMLVLSVEPGYGGQTYLPGSTARIARLREMLDAIGSTADLAVDGGLHPGNVRQVVEAGANVLVVGSAIFNAQASVTENIATLRRAAEGTG